MSKNAKKNETIIRKADKKEETKAIETPIETPIENEETENEETGNEETPPTTKTEFQMDVEKIEKILSNLGKDCELAYLYMSGKIETVTELKASIKTKYGLPAVSRYVQGIALGCIMSGLIDENLAFTVLDKGLREHKETKQAVLIKTVENKLVEKMVMKQLDKGNTDPVFIADLLDLDLETVKAIIDANKTE